MTSTEVESKFVPGFGEDELENLDVSQLTPLTPEIISRQATINIGTIGHVAHGKSTVVRAISGVQTVRFKTELERNITIKLERLSVRQIKRLCTSRAELRQYTLRQRALLTHLAHKRERHLHKMKIRQSSMTPSISPSSSSGYGGSGPNSSLGDDRSDVTVTPNSWRKQRDSTSNALQRKAKYNAHLLQIKPPRGEYVVEEIRSVELLDHEALFYVKWLNYPESTNTWEKWENLKDTEHLEEFVTERYQLYDMTIADILDEIETKIRTESLSYDVSALNVQELDFYDPLLLKVDLILLAQFRRAKSKSVLRRDFVLQRAVHQSLMMPYFCQRKAQLAELKQIEERINVIEHRAPLIIENNVDLDVIERNFTYIEYNIYGKDVPKELVKPPGCKCEENKCAPSTKCCARLHGNYFAYEKTGRMRLCQGDAVYECNQSCSCDESCPNRVIERGRKNQLTIFKTPSGCGWGVRTRAIMRKGDYVCEYVGEIVTVDEANERGKIYDNRGRTYLFDLDYNAQLECFYTIDAAVVGNVSHFINHSCDPNCAVIPFFKENDDPNMPRLAFFALRTILPGEEITFDYTRANQEDDLYQNVSDATRIECRCGATNCRKQLF